RADGRATGTPGEAAAADWLARAFARAGLVPDGTDGGWQHTFEFTAGVKLGPDNRLAIDDGPPEAGETWRPLAFSRSGTFDAAPVVFVGYGLVAAETEDAPAIDDFASVDVRGKWVLVFRDLPQTLAPERRRELQRHAGLRFKAMIARDRGARGVLIASGPLGRFREELVPLRFDASLAGTSIATLSITDAIAERLLEGTGRSLEAWHHLADETIKANEGGSISFSIGKRSVVASVDVQTERREGRNVLGRLVVGDAPSGQTIVIGAHYDHLGRGDGGNSLAGGEEAGLPHHGADDNASGTAVVVELAESLSARVERGENVGARDFVFAAWSGEELGLLGSNAWVGEAVNPHTNETGPVAYLNFDMVGRLRDGLVVQGLGSSPVWVNTVVAAATDTTLPLQLQEDSYVPTDATSFYTHGVPALSAFTGNHAEYHTPRDTIDRLNLDGTAKITALFERIALAVGRAASAPAYTAQTDPSGGRGRGGFRVYLGTIPDYANTDVVGVKLSGVAPQGPAENGGLRGGDVIIGADGRPIENLYDYTFALEAMQVGEPVRLKVLRDGEAIDIEVVPASRD
ncbi:MAG: M28 family peptidase, partial [Myxococcota bacterium]